MSRFFPRKTDLKAQKRKRNWRWGAWTSAAIAALVLGLYVLASHSGWWLVRDDSWNHVRYAVVLDGQGPDLERTTYAAGLLLDKKADTLIVLGRRIFRDQNAVDFYIPDLLRQGPVDAERILVLRHDDPSTIEEAYTLIPSLAARNADTVLLITSTAATKRVATIFNTLSQGKPYFITCDIGYFDYRPDTWIHTRESRKTWLREWAALLYAHLELWLAEPAKQRLEGNDPVERWKSSPAEPLLIPAPTPEKHSDSDSTST